MTLNTTSGFLNLLFAGKRLDYPFEGLDVTSSPTTSFRVPSSGNFNNDTIQLDTSNPTVPSFTYINGSKFSFVPQYGSEYSDGPWQPLAEGVSRGKNASDATKKPNHAPIVGAWGSWIWSWWTLGLIGVVSFV
jgi:hypothetical protein